MLELNSSRCRSWRSQLFACLLKMISTATFYCSCGQKKKTVCDNHAQGTSACLNFATQRANCCNVSGRKGLPVQSFFLQTIVSLCVACVPGAPPQRDSPDSGSALLATMASRLAQVERLRQELSIKVSGQDALLEKLSQMVAEIHNGRVQESREASLQTLQEKCDWYGNSVEKLQVLLEGQKAQDNKTERSSAREPRTEVVQTGGLPST